MRYDTWIVAMTIALLTNSMAADDLPKPTGKDATPPVDGEQKPEDPLRKARVKFLAEAAKHFEVFVGDDRVEAKRHPNPVLVYDNPVSGTKIGQLTVFARNNGRPDVMAQFSFSAPTAVYNEFHNLCDEKITMTRDSRPLWTPSETSTKWTPLKTNEKPTATPLLRLVQMRRLAEKFVVEDDFGWDKKERHQLRLLPTPVYRYGNADDPLVDGAVFVYALATDPEAVLMLECVKTDAGLGWQYGFGPMSIYALSAKLDGEVVWDIPERKVFGSQKSVQFVSPYWLAAAERYPE